MGSARSLEVGFEYRPQAAGMSGHDTNEAGDGWKSTAFVSRTTAGRFSIPIQFLRGGETYEFRLVVKHPLLTSYGIEKTFTTK